MIKYCNTCILPNTRPNIQFDAKGNCNCATLEKKQKINWVKRENDYKKIVKEAISKNRPYYVSGGKIAGGL